MKIGIVGGGFVGSATSLLACKDITTVTFDLNPERCIPKGTVVSDLTDCDFVFVCVPTPTHESGECNLRIVETCIRGLQKNNIHNIVLRSTVPPGTSESLGVSFMPEFLTEANWKQDFYTCSTWVFAGRTPEDCVRFQRLLTLAKDNNAIQSDVIQFVSTKEAEMIKYVRNNFLALKISFFNEIHSVCKAIGVDYEHVRNGVTADERIGKTHTGVPGYDGHFGFGGTCLPKDTSALLHFMTEKEIPSHIVKAMVYRNIHVDRPECDWKQDPRAFTATGK
jgi:UDPglucose 6-dehydrogenase